MALPDEIHYGTARRGKSPLAALWHRARLAHYRFRLTYGLTCQTPGEEVITHLVCGLLLMASLWLSYRVLAYSTGLLMHSIPRLGGAVSVQAVVDMASKQVKRGLHSLERTTIFMHATSSADLTSIPGSMANNASTPHIT